MKLHLLNITNFKVDGGAMFGVIPKVLWSRVYESDENNLIVLSLRSLVVETDNRVVLVDAGWGNKQDRKFFRHLYLHGGEGLIDGLRSRGFSKEDITDVFITHLHADHCGGCSVPNGNGYEMTFPNAVIHVNRIQWEWAVRNNPREEDSFLEENILPLLQSGKLNLIGKEGELFAGFSVRFFFGHTPGLMIPVLNMDGKTIIFAGDLIPTSAHIPLIWNMSYDIEPLKAINEKSLLLNEALENDCILVFQHDENIECCNLQMTPKGIRAKNKFSLSEVLAKHF